MKFRTVLMALTLLALVAGTFAMTGCNTWNGAGKDVERAGEKMQHHDHD